MSSDPWTSWLSVDAISFENQALTKALQVSLSNGNDTSSPSSPSSSSIGESLFPAAAAAAGRVWKKTDPGMQAGKIAKRKSRAKKRTPTTYIDADPESFRAMVQQMTGAGAGLGYAGPVIKPEPKRQSFVPRTLDKSGFLLGGADDNAGSAGARLALDEEELLGFDVDAFLSFPTLESWDF